MIFKEKGVLSYGWEEVSQSRLVLSFLQVGVSFPHVKVSFPQVEVTFQLLQLEYFSLT
jgi:hypothetical protein